MNNHASRGFFFVFFFSCYQSVYFWNSCGTWQKWGENPSRRHNSKSSFTKWLLLDKSDLYGFSSDRQTVLYIFLYVWDNDPIRQQQLGTQDYCFLLIFFFFFYCSLLTSPALATITIQYMHCFIKIKNCTGQFRYIIFQIFFCCYSLNILINRRCKKVSAWWWFLPPTQCFLQTVNYSAALCFCFWQIFQGFFFCFVLVTCLKDWTFFFCFVLF